MSKVATRSEALSRGFVLKLAQQYLDEHQPSDYRLVARADKVQKLGSAWYVQIDPVPEDASSGDFINRMVEAQMDLQEREGLEIELTNMLPREIMAAETLFPRFANALLSDRKQPKRSDRSKARHSRQK